MEMLEKTLQKLGFYDKEIAVYLEILRRGKTTPAALSKVTGINRGTIYSVSKSLLEKGVISEDLGGTSRYFVALPPEDLTTLIEKEKKELDTKKRLVWKAIDELAELPLNTQYAVPKIRFVEDENVLDHLYKYTNEYIKSAHNVDATWWGFQDNTFTEHFEKWIDWVWEQERNQFVKLLSNESNIEEKMKMKQLPQREVRFWKKDINFTATTWVLGDYLLMIYTQERPHYLIEIHNPVLAHNMREVFKNIWKTFETPTSDSDIE